MSVTDDPEWPATPEALLGAYADRYDLPLADVHHVFTIADVHGDLNALLYAMRTYEIIDEEFNWNPRLHNAAVVILGDMVDARRNHESTDIEFKEWMWKMAWYLTRWQVQAQEHHCQLVRLVGNHELDAMEREAYVRRVDPDYLGYGHYLSMGELLLPEPPPGRRKGPGARAVAKASAELLRSYSTGFMRMFLMLSARVAYTARGWVFCHGGWTPDYDVYLEGEMKNRPEGAAEYIDVAAADPDAEKHRKLAMRVAELNRLYRVYFNPAAERRYANDYEWMERRDEWINFLMHGEGLDRLPSTPHGWAVVFHGFREKWDADVGAPLMAIRAAEGERQAQRVAGGGGGNVAPDIIGMLDELADRGSVWSPTQSRLVYDIDDVWYYLAFVLRIVQADLEGVDSKLEFRMIDLADELHLLLRLHLADWDAMRRERGVAGQIVAHSPSQYAKVDPVWVGATRQFYTDTMMSRAFNYKREPFDRIGCAHLVLDADVGNEWIGYEPSDAEGRRPAGGPRRGDPAARLYYRKLGSAETQGVDGTEHGAYGTEAAAATYADNNVDLIGDMAVKLEVLRIRMEGYNDE
jgi:hypothetical protein